MGCSTGKNVHKKG